MKLERALPPRAAARRPLLGLLGIALGLLAGCQGEKTTTPPLGPRLLPNDVADQLQTVYRNRDAAGYAGLLADDYTFIPARFAWPDSMPNSWSRAPDSTCTERLFRAGVVSGIRATLTHMPDVADNAVNRPGWRRIRVVDTFLEVDWRLSTDENLTYRVDGDVQDLFVRLGRNAADTLATSPTAQEWFLVQWQDLGRLEAAAGPPAADSPTPVSAVTWSAIKLLCAPQGGVSR